MKFCPDCASPLQLRTVDGATRPACPAPGCGFVFWDNPVPVVAAAVELDGHIVLARNRRWPPGVRSVITGYLEKDETPEQAVRREVREELGLNTDTLRFVGHYALRVKNQLILVYAVQARGDIVLGEELADYVLVPRDELGAGRFGAIGGPAREGDITGFREWLLQHALA